MRQTIIIASVTTIRATFLGLWMVIAGSQLLAQTPIVIPHNTRELGEVKFTTIYQDKKGWIWLGGQGGVYRYDGVDFTHFVLPDSLGKPIVTAMVDYDNQLWIGFKNGLIGQIQAASIGNYLPTVIKQQWEPQIDLWQPEEGLPGHAITGFVEDQKGALWFSTYGEGLYCWRNKRLYLFDNRDEKLAGNELYDIARDREGKIWVGADSGISCCTMDENGRKTVESFTTTNSALPDEIVTALATDYKGNIVIGTYEHGICRFNAEKHQFEPLVASWPYGVINKLTCLGTDEIWVGTNDEGVIRVNAASGEMFPLEENAPLRHAKTVALTKDREGLVWAVFTKGEFCSFNARFGWTYTPFQDVQAVWMDASGRIWAGSREGLFVRENAAFRTVLPKENILALWEDPEGNIWAGTFGNGLFVLDNQGNLIRHLTESEGLANNNILSIAGKSGHAWLSTLGGVNSVALPLDKTGGQIRFRNELGSSYVYKVFPDSKGRVWFGTDGKGLAYWENNQYHFLVSAGATPLKTIYSIVEDASGKIWFSTDKDGLFSYDGTTFDRFTTENRLHSMAISGLAVDRNGMLVIGYEHGVDLLNPARRGHFTHVGSLIGAPDAQVALNAMCTDSRGNVWLGCAGGIFSVTAYSEPFTDDPHPDLTGVSVDLKPVDFESVSLFGHEENNFVFSFKGLWYTNPEAVLYRYRLEGFDPDWKISKDHQASYPNLPPGHYRFRIQTTEHGNFDQVPETAWEFTIKSPFWEKWWFVLLCFLSGAGLLYGFIHYREVRYQREANLKREKVESQFAALKSQINPHFLFNSFNTLITIIEENPKMAVAYVEHLADFFRSMMVYREKDLIAIQEELELVENFGYLLKKRYEDNFTLDIKVQPANGYIMPLSLQILVENAVKHNIISAAKPLKVEIFNEENRWFVVRNNIQRKIKPEPSTHFGLHSLKKKYQLLSELQVIVEETDAVFTVKIPIIWTEPRHASF